VTAFRSHQKDSKQFFITQGELSACKNIKGLMAGMNIRYILEEWRLFIDSSMHSLEAVLLHKGNVLPLIPVAYVIHKQKTYENMKEILSCMNYQTHQWRNCSDLKVIAILMGLQKGCIAGKLQSNFESEAIQHKGTSSKLNLSTSIFLTPTDDEEIISLIEELKNIKSSGLDGISSFLIKKCYIHLIKPLTFIINLSLNTGEFPELFKIAKVRPLLKKG
jgi:hypothetical protein